MIHITSAAIVLSKRQLLNDDLLVELFTKEEGKVRLVVKNASVFKSRRRPAFDSGNLVTVTLKKDAQGFSLKEIDIISGLTKLKAQSLHSSCLYQSLFVLREIVQEVSEVALFEDILYYIKQLSNCESENLLVVQSTFLNMIVEHLGILDSSLTYLEAYATVQEAVQKKIPIVDFV
jgi:DNA repair protein RecO